MFTVEEAKLSLSRHELLQADVPFFQRGRVCDWAGTMCSRGMPIPCFRFPQLHLDAQWPCILVKRNMATNIPGFRVATTMYACMSHGEERNVVGIHRWLRYQVSDPFK